MKKSSSRPIVAKALTALAVSMIKSSANSSCAFVYHQPKQPEELKKFRKF